MCKGALPDVFAQNVALTCSLVPLSSPSLLPLVTSLCFSCAACLPCCPLLAARHYDHCYLIASAITDLHTQMAMLHSLTVR